MTLACRQQAMRYEIFASFLDIVSRGETLRACTDSINEEDRGLLQPSKSTGHDRASTRQRIDG